MRSMAFHLSGQGILKIELGLVWLHVLGDITSCVLNEHTATERQG